MSYPRDSIDPNRYTADPNEDPDTPFRNLDTAPTTLPVATTERLPDSWNDVVDADLLTADEVVERQRQRFGGVKIGSAFFGWLIAVGVVMIVTGVIAIVAVALGFDVTQSPRAMASDIPLDADTVTWTGVGALMLLLFAAFYCGGYVAGRMARFNGIVQGLAVWGWALVVAIAAAIMSVLLGMQNDVLGYADAFPRLPVADGVMTIALITAAVLVAVATLGGAMLGGVIGVRYHRRVDRFGLEG
ncbi:hypothetical protein [Agromyces neolithicus]|uniref:Major facilitator superfamily (MFS) profile domain-containing protein n=1 Tax=Agromyces neolithicus TaxID=269420 RepID=A0ABN2M7H7_9MICO